MHFLFCSLHNFYSKQTLYTFPIFMFRARKILLLRHQLLLLHLVHLFCHYYLQVVVHYFIIMQHQVEDWH